MVATLVGLIILVNRAEISLPPRYYKLEDVLKAIQPISDKPLRIGASIPDVPAFLALKSLSLPQVKSKIARLYYATWVKDGQGERLELDSETRRAEFREGNKKWTLAIETSLDKEMQELLVEGAISVESIQAYNKKLQEEAQKRANAGQSAVDEIEKSANLETRPIFDAARHTIIPLLKRIGAQTLAKIPFGNYAFYCTSPNRAERQFPAGSTSALREFVRNQTLVRSAKGAFDSPGISMQSAGGMQIFGDIKPEFLGRPQDTTEAYLSIYRSYSLKGLVCEISIYDRELRGVAKATHFVPIGGIPGETIDHPFEQLDPEAKELTEKARGWLAKTGYDKLYGARPMARKPIPAPPR